MALKDLFSKKSADNGASQSKEQEPVGTFEQQLEQLETTGISDIAGIPVEVKRHAAVSEQAERFGEIVKEILSESVNTAADVTITEPVAVPDNAMNLSFEAVGVTNTDTVVEVANNEAADGVTEDSIVQESIVPQETDSDESVSTDSDIVYEEVSEDVVDTESESVPDEFTSDISVEESETQPIIDMPSPEAFVAMSDDITSDSVAETQPIAEDVPVSEENEPSISTDVSEISDTNYDSSAISDVNKTEEVADMSDVNKMLDSEMADYTGYDKSSSANIKENIIIPDEEPKLVIPEEGSEPEATEPVATEPVATSEDDIATTAATVSAAETETVEVSLDKNSTEALPDFYTDNAKLILLLRKMGILDAVERIAAGEEIPTAELLKATAPIQRLSSAYKEAESLAATYLESYGINFKNLAGEDYAAYNAVQILFIGDKVRNKFKNIKAILNPAFSVAQMSCICELEDAGVNTEWCKPTMSPSVMKALADLWRLNYDMSVIAQFDSLTWHGVTLIMMAERMGFTDIGEFMTDSKTLNENELYNKLNALTKEADEKKAELCDSGIEYKF